ncbi:MAG: RNA polymerase sigma factor [Bacteroidales bacterium]
MKNSKNVYKNIHQDIIDSCRKGDRKAQFQLYKLYYKNMYNLSLRIINDSQEAEDIMQESFLSAFEKMGSYSGEVSFGAWLKRIVINKSLDAVKKRKIDFLNLDESAGNLPPEVEADDFEEVSLQVEKIHKCINLLPDGYRIVLSLYLLEGYDHEEIAEILNISASTSRSQYTRARHKLYELLKDK